MRSSRYASTTSRATAAYVVVASVVGKRGLGLASWKRSV
jgi:hypothetical protein